MDAHSYSRLTIELHNNEVETMRDIVRLAHDRLRNAPKQQMKGAPLEKQAGLVGPDLFRVKDMLEKLGKAVGIELPYDAEPTDPPSETLVFITVIGEVKP